jgi:hypothetical protein
MNDKFTTELIRWIEVKLGISDPSQWYHVKLSHIQQLKANVSFSGRGHNIYDILKKIYPDFDWHIWMFDYSPIRLWQDESTKKSYFEWLKSYFNIGNDPAEWYNVLGKDFPHFGGLIHHYTKFEFIKSMIPDYDWKEWLFNNCPNGYWQDKNNHKKYGKWLEEQLDLTNHTDWYDVSQDDFKYFNGGSLLGMYYGGSPQLFVTTNFPEYDLDITKFKKLRKGQAILYKTLQRIFPNEELLWEYKHPEIRSALGRKLELDIFIPNMNLAFEYQGQQHYKDHKYFKDNDKRIQENDILKKSRCKELGISLYEIPFDWNRKESYIRNLIEA